LGFYLKTYIAVTIDPMFKTKDYFEHFCETDQRLGQIRSGQLYGNMSYPKNKLPAVSPCLWSGPGGVWTLDRLVALFASLDAVANGDGAEVFEDFDKALQCA